MTRPYLTIGMATYDDFEGTYWTIQSLRLFQPEAIEHCELLVVDNHPGGLHGQMIQGLVDHWVKSRHRARYVPFTEVVGTSASRNRVFEEAEGEAVLCLDSHVMLEPGSLTRLLDFYATHPDCLDLLSGPMYYDNLASVVTHFDDVWRAEMWGIWGDDSRGHDADGEPFEISAMGLGLFSCRKDAWLGFNDHCRGFGGEEFYIHEKFRQAGRKCLCLPFLRWLHRFGRPAGVAYPLTRWNKVRNYVLEHQELGLPLDRVHKHFVLGEPETLPDGTLAKGPMSRMPESEWEYLLEDPIGHELPPGSGQKGGCGGCPGSVASLDELYQKAISEPSDINEHASKLRELASQCDHVTEFGMRHGVSTVALLAGQPKRFITYDLAVDGMSGVLKKYQGATEFDFRQGDVLGVDIEETDLLFIDTRHTAEQLSAELARHADKVRRWIALHDTQIFGLIGEGGGPGLLVALRAFLKEHPEWSVVYHVQNNYGLTIISRDKRDKPKLPGKIRMAANFAKAVAEHFAGGADKASAEGLKARLEICTLCDQRVEDRCSVCGCFIAVKGSWKEQDCPLGKWPDARQ